MLIPKPCGTIEITGASRKVIVSATLGNAGWSPVLSLVADGNRRVFQVVDWVGGSGTPPATGGYIGSSGLVSSISSAVDVRGSPGPPGDRGASAYEVALQNGFVGTEQEWLESLEKQWDSTNW